MVAAIKDLCALLPNGKEDYYSEIANFTRRIYTKISNKNTLYFLDKTPRYHLIADDILSIFPEGKFIFLWRNPLSIISSIIDTWGRGRWNLYNFKIDIFRGLVNLIETFENNKDKVYGLRYENLITNPEDELRKIFTYLNLNFKEDSVSEFSQVFLLGKMGDQLGKQNYNHISSQPLTKWEKTLCNPVQKYGVDVI